MQWWYNVCNGPLARYVKLRIAHASGMPGTFFLSTQVSDLGMYHGTCVTHVPWCMPGSLTNGFLWSRWRGKRSRHSRRLRKPQFNVSGKRPILYSHQKPLMIYEIEKTTSEINFIFLWIWLSLSVESHCKFQLRIQNICPITENELKVSITFYTKWSFFNHMLVFVKTRLRLGDL